MSEQVKNEKLLPCPWCGKKAELVIYAPEFFAYCPNKKCPEKSTFNFKKDAIKAWNTRTTRTEKQ